MVRHDDLGNGAHADSVATEHAEHAILGRCLEGRALNTNVGAVHDADVLFLCNLVGQCNKLQVVRLMHVGEARSGGEVLAAQRVLGEEVDVVGDNHQLANLELGVHAAGGIADEERLDAQLIHHANGERHLLHRVALVEVETTLHGHDVLAAQTSEDELAGVALDGGDGEVGNLGIGELVGFSYF